MKLAELQQFLTDCHNRGVEIPNNFEVVIEDFYDTVPEEWHNIKRLEHITRVGNVGIKVFVKPPSKD